jgi:hypothetical protein
MDLYSAHHEPAHNYKKEVIGTKKGIKPQYLEVIKKELVYV